MPAHRLGPSVVGRRIVVRYLLDDGRATDVVGICTSWGDGRVVIERDSGRSGGAGGSVELPLAAIVTGKPVPPRASVRQRVSARDIERHSFADWDEMVVHPVGEWWVRHSPPVRGRLLKRGNSALAMGDPGMPVSEAAERVAEVYAGLGRPPLAQVERGSAIEAELGGLGWSPLGEGDSATLVASVSRTRRVLGEVADLDAERAEGDQALKLLLPEGAGRAQGALDDDWLCLHSLVVDPSRRRRGIATALIAELLEWGAERGATTAWLHVETDNEPALALYESLGFLEHHRCRYFARG